MAKKKQSVKLDVTRITRTMYFFIGFFALSIVIFDSGDLLTRDRVNLRWAIMSILLFVNTSVWYLASKPKFKSIQNLNILFLSLATLIFAGFMTYWERGMASTSTILYVIPLLIVATMKSRHALFAISIAAAGTYSFASVKYFNDFFNEGYRIQLWGHIVLYVGAILTMTWLIMILTGLRHDSK